ncbi:MAG TPA: diguanylate cyclase [Thermoanaerobaculia bacterium]|nr:diguanylate cyclase [Thermoanaerobaculia bacterium]
MSIGVPAGPGPRGGGSGRRVLVVDDSEVTRAILARTLRGAGFEVLEARDGVEGALAALAERPAVVVTDLEMPTLDGFPLLRLLKADPASAHIPVLILTGHGEAAARFWGLRTGADAYLTKDHRPHQLVALVESLADRTPPAPAAGAVELPPAVGPLEVLARVARHLDASLLQATVINTLLERGLGAGDFAEACRVALQTVAEVVDASFLAVALAEPDSATVEIALEEAVSKAAVKALEEQIVAQLEIPPGTPIAKRVHGELGQVEIDPTTAVWVGLPVRDARGVLALAPRDPWQFAAGGGLLVDGLVGHLSLVLDNARLAQRLHELSTVDGLTRQLNRRAIFDRLGEELRRARRYRLPLSVVLCDFDHFKEVNDSHGHMAGDAVLREGAMVLRHSLRGSDMLGRYGGEEFLAVLPQVDLESARQAAERLRRDIEQHRVRLPAGAEVRITASFGVASSSELAGRPKITGDRLVSLADRRLYLAKAAGRNCVQP